jgi:hypothetical protein
MNDTKAAVSEIDVLGGHSNAHAVRMQMNCCANAPLYITHLRTRSSLPARMIASTF